MTSFIYRERVEKCYEVKLGETFDEVKSSILQNVASMSSVPLEFLVPPLITATAHFLNKSEINPWGNWYQPSIIYFATVGFTGTNKTAALDCIRNSITDVETVNEVSDMSSRINQLKLQATTYIKLGSTDAAAVSCHCRIITKTTESRQIWDELKTWQSSLGLYKTGSASDYDTTIYLTAYNGGTLKRQTCSTNVSVKKPVVNICGMAHPGKIIKVLDEERKNTNNNDGLYSRFLVCMPRPEFLDADASIQISQELPSLSRLFYVVDNLHREKKMYTYTDEAKEEAIKFYNEQQEFLRVNHSTETYTSGEFRLINTAKSLKIAHVLIDSPY